ncbi:EamA family transporter [Thermodesulfatator atlanticus]|uniref:EamA family transporter n=1 Tax=Thermodesulfatator atlanticus TaxID=501497 RepID=UPI0003B75DBF|nr:EamA family transporter [Thermodesulfatator atlanticus]
MNLKVFFLWLLTICFWGSAPLLEKLALKGMSPLFALTMRTGFAAIILVVATSLTGEYREISQLDSKTIIAACLSGILAGVLGMFTYFSLLKIGQASKIVPLTATYPLVTALLAYLFLGEKVSLMRLCGIILTVSGLIVLLRS